MSRFGAFISELEDAFQSGVPEKRAVVLRRVTDLFVNTANVYTDEHVELFDDVIGRLTRGIEAKARAELSSRLAPVANAPIGVIKALGSDDAIESPLRSSPNPAASAMTIWLKSSIPRVKVTCWPYRPEHTLNIS